MRRTDLAVRLIRARSALGWSQETAADKIHVHRNTVIGWERTKNPTVPNFAQLLQAAEAYGIDRLELMPLWHKARKARKRRGHDNGGGGK